MKRWVKRCAWCVLGLLSLPVLIAVLSVARLAYGPVSLGPFAHYAATRTNAAFLDINLDFADMMMSWERVAGTLELRFQDVSLRIPGANGGDPTAQVPELSIVFDIPPLFTGNIRPTHVLIRHPDVRAQWNAEDLIAFLKGASDENMRTVSFDVPELLTVFIERLTSRYDPNGIYAGLEHVRVEDGLIVLTETGSSTEWKIPDADLSFSRSDAGLAVTGEGRLFTDEETLAGAFSFSATTKRSASVQGMDLRLDDIWLPALARNIPAFSRISGIDMPMDADLGVDIGPAPERRVAISLMAKAAAGSLRLSPWYETPRPFKGIDLAALYDSKQREVELTGLIAHLPDTTLFVSGHIVHGRSGLPAVSLKGGFGQLSLKSLTTYWPDGVAAGGKNWIADNLEKGVIENGTLRLDLPTDDWTEKVMSGESFQLDFTFDDLEAHVLRPMPPILDASGRGFLTSSGLLLHVDGGLADGLPVAGSTVNLTRFNKPGPQLADIALRMKGPVPAILRLIDYEPLGYSSAFGIEPDMIGGVSDLEAILGFPLIRSLSMDDVDIVVTGTVDELHVPHVFGQRSLEDGSLGIKVTRDGLHADGTGRVGPAGLAIDWTETFKTEPGMPSSRFEIHTRLDEQKFADLLIDPRGMLAGSMDVDIVLEGRGPLIQTGRVNADLSQSRLLVSALDWAKPANEPATLTFTLDFSDRQYVMLQDFTLTAADDRLQGQLVLDAASGAFQRARIDRLNMGLTDLDGSLYQEGDGYVVRLNGRSLDARPLLDRLNTPSDDPENTSDTDSLLSSLDIALSLDSLIGLNGVEFSNLEASGRKDNQRWQMANLRMALDNGSAIAVDLVPMEDGAARALTLIADDAGRTLKGLGFYPNVIGGVLSLNAQLLNSSGHIVAEGLANLKDFRLVQKVTIDTPEEMADVDGLDSFIGPDGLFFTTMRLPFKMKNGIIDIDDARANGPRLGLTLEGQIDEHLEQVNMNGVFVPAYGLNSLLGKIPIIGGLFSGGSGGGIFALSYRVSGSTKDPLVRINPFTVLMPGILRKPFEGTKGTLDDIPPLPDEPGPDSPVRDGTGQNPKSLPN